MQKQTEFYETRLKNTCKNCFTKIIFQIQYFDGPHNIKYSLVYYQTPNCIFYIANAKAGAKQKHTFISLHVLHYYYF